MFGPWQEVPLTPLQKSTKSDLGVGADLDLIFVWPHMQADQHHPNTHGVIQLQQQSRICSGPQIIVGFTKCERVSKHLMQRVAEVTESRCWGDMCEYFQLGCEDSQLMVVRELLLLVIF